MANLSVITLSTLKVRTNSFMPGKLLSMIAQEASGSAAFMTMRERHSDILKCSAVFSPLPEVKFGTSWLCANA